MNRDISRALSASEKIRKERHPSAKALLLAGSVVRGDATAFSDLDLVVIYEHVNNAKRQSFTYDGWPVEAFVHDPQTLEYFIQEVDGPSGVPTLANMICEAVEVPKPTKYGQEIKCFSKKFLNAGPMPWGQQERENSRYAISNMVDDIRAPRSTDELRPVIANLYTAIANHYCRSRTQWAAKGKSIPRRLTSLDPEFSQRFAQAFEVAFVQNDVVALIDLSQDVLEADGGFLFDGYNRNAPDEWRIPD